MSGKIDARSEPRFPAPQELQTQSNRGVDAGRSSVQFFSARSGGGSEITTKNERGKKAPKTLQSEVELKSNVTEGVQRIEAAFTDGNIHENKKLFGRGTPFKTPNIRGRESVTHKTPLAGLAGEVRGGSRERESVTHRTPLAGLEHRKGGGEADDLRDSFTPDQGLSSMLKQHGGYSFKKDAENKIPIVEDQTPVSSQGGELLSRSLFKGDQNSSSIFQEGKKDGGLFKDGDKKLSIFHSDFQGNHQVASSLKGLGGRRMGDSGFFRNFLYFSIFFWGRLNK